MISRLRLSAALLFASGFCALIYQTTWLREFRSIFGGSTAASAVVLGIFMGGLGFGSLILGRRSEIQSHPLRFYGKLELFIAVSAAVSPLLLMLTRAVYFGLGGTLALGTGVGISLRLLLSVMAIGLPTFLMGGTLPAMARVVTTAADTNRRAVAVLYGMNTLGAVVGAATATFCFLEFLGNTMTLAVAVIVNLLVAAAAFWIAKAYPPATDGGEERRPAPNQVIAPAAPPPFVLAASAIVGFAFLLMELVWYRMLAPLLGGSTFTFGLILVIALLGIGLGGLIYSISFSRRSVGLTGFAIVSALEALFIAIPFAMGDRIAITTMVMRQLGSHGFLGFVLGWSAICAIVTLIPAIISGVQFPMLIALLGRGESRVGSQTGTAYAFNTAGAIAGSLAGGFGLLPALTAPGVWRGVVVLLGALAATACVLSIRHRSGWLRQIPALILVAISVALITATGPTSFWRHSEIGVGRLSKVRGTPNEYHDLINTMRRDILWDAEGVESSVALSYGNGINFVVNGRCDGNAKGDSGTQVMLGLLPAALQGNTTDALVIGLGTGSTAGWLGAIPEMQRVDVVELEPAIVRIAQACTAVNHQPLENPKVHVVIGDGREVLLTTKQKYDVIASEPSNPYRAGIASLFTREFYQAAAARLKPGGLFVQWLQAYEIDTEMVGMVYATLGSVFPQIDTWQTDQGDLVFVGSAQPRTFDADLIKKRIAEEPFKSAMLNTWGATNVESFLAHFVGNNSLASELSAGRRKPINTDDKTVLEFAFARTVHLGGSFHIPDLRQRAKIDGADRLSLSAGDIDWKKVEQARLPMLLGFGVKFDPNEYTDPVDKSRAAAYASYEKSNFDEALASWRTYPREPLDANDLRFLAECLAAEGSEAALPAIEDLRQVFPVDADAIRAFRHYRRGEFQEAGAILEQVLVAFRTNPWPSRELIEQSVFLAQSVVDNANSKTLAMRMFGALRQPFSLYSAEEPRRLAVLRLAMELEQEKYGELTLAAIEPLEPRVPWQMGFLTVRAACYRALGNPRSAQADRDLQEFTAKQSAH